MYTRALTEFSAVKIRFLLRCILVIRPDLYTFIYLKSNISKYVSYTLNAGYSFLWSVYSVEQCNLFFAKDLSFFSA